MLARAAPSSARLEWFSVLLGESAGAAGAGLRLLACAASAPECAIASVLCALITESRICCQFCQATAASEALSRSASGSDTALEATAEEDAAAAAANV